MSGARGRRRGARRGVAEAWDRELGWLAVEAERVRSARVRRQGRAKSGGGAAVHGEQRGSTGGLAIEVAQEQLLATGSSPAKHGVLRAVPLAPVPVANITARSPRSPPPARGRDLRLSRPSAQGHVCAPGTARSANASALPPFHYLGARWSPRSSVISKRGCRHVASALPSPCGAPPRRSRSRSAFHSN